MHTGAEPWTANAAASFAVARGSDEERLRNACAATLDDGLLRTETIGELHFYVAPLFDEAGRCNAAVALATPLESLPQVLYSFQQPLPNFGRIIHELPVPVGVARSSGRFDYFNDRWYAVFGLDRRAPQPDPFLTRCDERDRSSSLAAWHAGIAGNTSFSFRARFRTLAGERWFHVAARPMREDQPSVRWICTLTDVDAEMRVHRALQASENDLRAISRASAGLGRAAQWEHVSEAVRNIGFEGDDGWLLLPGAGHTFADTEYDDGSAERFVRIPPHDACLSIRGAGPLAELEERTETAASEIALRVGAVLDRLAAVEREGKFAERLQRAMLPTELPQVEGVRTEVAYKPAEHDMLVGADWYDAFVLPDGRVAFTIGDVAGHGGDAALAMGTIRHPLRANAFTSDDPATILAAINRALWRDGIVASAIMGTLDRRLGALALANAGHPRPYLIHADGIVRSLAGNGVLLGVREDAPAATQTLLIEDAAALVLYTDGLIEANRDFVASEVRLEIVLARWAREGFREDAAALQRLMLDGNPARDDVAMMILRLEAPQGTPEKSAPPKRAT